jgi:hypothetical protein
MIQHPTGPAALAVTVPEGIAELAERAWMTPAAFEIAENLALIAAYAHHRLTQPRRLCVASSVAAMSKRTPAPVAGNESPVLPPG